MPGRINDEDIATVRERARIDEVVGSYVSLRNGLTVAWKDGRLDTYEERKVPSGGRSYWGVSHELLIRDFYAKVDDPEPFWISPAEAMKSLQILKKTYEVSGF